MKTATVAISYRPSMARTIAKTATYKLLTFVAMFSLALWHTGDFGSAAKLATGNLLFTVTFYVLHERAWARVDAGKQGERC